jgi:hypothetical protein
VPGNWSDTALIASSRGTDVSPPHSLWLAVARTWKTKPAAVKRGTWCLRCGNEGRRHTLDMMKEVALQRGGKCLSGEFVTTRAKLRWRYATGHEWNATASSVLDGGWCTQCYYDSMRGTLAQMQTLAASRGGRCLAEHTSMRGRS